MSMRLIDLMAGIALCGIFIGTSLPLYCGIHKVYVSALERLGGVNNAYVLTNIFYEICSGKRLEKKEIMYQTKQNIHGKTYHVLSITCNGSELTVLAGGLD